MLDRGKDLNNLNKWIHSKTYASFLLAKAIATVIVTQNVLLAQSKYCLKFFLKNN
jgi:hypothetical protein